MNDLGYESASYAASFEHDTTVVQLPRSGVFLAKREIGDDRFDLAGLYPMTCCQNWSRFADDVDEIREGGAVSIVLVTEPFAALQASRALDHWTTCGPFKTHVIVELDAEWPTRRPKRVREDVRRSLRLQSVEVVDDPVSMAPDFWSLYQHSVRRHDIPDGQRLSEPAITSQLAVDGAVLVVARTGPELHGVMLSYDMGEHAFLHLTAQTPRGYDLFTSYALIQTSLEELARRGCRRASLGGAAGVRDDADDSLFRFKGRWSPSRAGTLLCGNVLDRAAYDSLVAQTANADSVFFPAYRTPQQ